MVLRKLAVFFIYTVRPLWYNIIAHSDRLVKYFIRKEKNMKKRILSLMLCVLMAAGAVSCGGDAPSDDTDKTPGDSTDTQPADTEDRSGVDDLPELNFGGAEFNILTYKDGNLPANSTSWPNYFQVDTETGDLVNDAAYRRNRTVEERLNITIKAQESAGSVVSDIQTAVLANDPIYDLALPLSSDTFTGLIAENMLFDFATARYMDLSKDYYTQDCTETYRIGDKVFVIAGAYPFPQFASSYLVVNKGAWEDRKLPDIYEMVKSGEWTHEKMMTIIKDTYEDTNGNSQADAGDFFGFHAPEVMLQYLYPIYGGISAVSGEDGFEFGYEKEKAVTIMEKIMELLNSKDAYCLPTAGWDNFLNGNTLLCFYGSSFYRLRDLEFDYGIIPLPKLDETQENYYTLQQGGTLLVPTNVEDPDMVSAAIEALFSESHKTMLAAFTEKFVENKLLRDDGSVEMYEILVDTAKYDLTKYIDPSNGMIGQYKLIYSLIQQKSANMASAWAGVKEAVEKSYGDFFDKVTEAE